MPAELHLVVGEAYLLTHTINIPKGLAKSSWVNFVDLVIRDEQNSVRWDGQRSCHVVDADHASAFVGRLQHKGWKDEDLFDGLNPGEVVLGTRQASTTVDMRDGRSIPLAVEQLGLQWSAVLTGHRVQGQTFDRDVCLCGLCHPRAHVSRKWLYVGCSRTTKSSYLHFADMPKVDTASFNRICPLEGYAECLLDTAAVETELRISIASNASAEVVEAIRARHNSAERLLFASDAKVLHYFEHYTPSGKKKNKKKRKKESRRNSSSNSNAIRSSTNSHNSTSSSSRVRNTASKRRAGDNPSLVNALGRKKRRRRARGRKKPRPTNKQKKSKKNAVSTS
jgi:hypothetical protein